MAEEVVPMMHSKPMPLKIAFDMAKRLHHELASHMSPEQKRDFIRMLKMLQESEMRHRHEVKHLKAQLQAAAATPAKPAKKWGLF